MNKGSEIFWELTGSALIGIGIFLLVAGPAILDPSYISWIVDGDPMQQYLGWEFFRNSPWEFPLGLSTQFGIDLGSSIVYSDSIPLPAIIFKASANLLPRPFQYFGWWTLLCFTLQAIVAGRLAGLMTKDIALKFLVIGLLTFSIPLLWRLGFHNYLLAQFLILAGIYLNFSKDSPKHFIFWVPLLVVAVLVNFYLFVMVMVLWMADIVDRFRHKVITFQYLSIYSIWVALLLGVLAWQAGYFSVGSSSSFITGMYGQSRLNLVTLFDANGWSWTIKTIFPNIKSYASNNYESFHFLGLGLLCALPIAIFLVKRDRVVRNSLRSISIEHFALLLLLILLVCFAISNWISIGPYSWHFPVPQFLFNLATTLRSSGRLFLPAYYLIVLVIVYAIICGFSTRRAKMILVLVLILQILDSMPGWLPKRIALEGGYLKENPNALVTPLNNHLWSPLASHYKNIITVFDLPQRGVIPEHWSTFAALAAKHQLPTNSIYLARYDESKLAVANKKYELAVTSGKYDPTTLYIIDDERVMPVLMHLDPQKDLFARIDGFNVLAPGWVACSACSQPPTEVLIKKTYPKIKINEIIGFGKGQVGTAFLIGIDQRQIKGWGWAYPEQWGVWTEGSKAKVVLPIPAGNPKTLTMDFRAFLTASHPKQLVEVFVNNVFDQKIVFSQDQANHIIIDLPQNDSRDYIAIELRLPDAKSPKDLGIGDDIRPLGVGLTQVEFR